MNPLETRALGGTGISLTQMGFGGGAIGELYAPIPEADSRSAIAAAWEAGMRYFDTAPWYGIGLAELRLGAGLRGRPRDDFVLSSKVGRLLSAPPVAERGRAPSSQWVGGLNFRFRFDYTYDGVMRSFEDSIQRLGLERIDLLVIHDLDRWHFEPDQVAAHMRALTGSGYRALEQLKADGTVAGIGAGINHVGTISQFLDAVALDFFVVATCFTLIDQGALPEMRRARAAGMGFVIGGVFNGGIGATGAVPGAKFNYRDADAEMLERVRRIEAVCADHKVPLAAAALQFPMRLEGAASVIPGVISGEQVTRNLAGFGHPIPPALWAELESKDLVVPVAA